MNLYDCEPPSLVLLIFLASVQETEIHVCESSQMFRLNRLRPLYGRLSSRHKSFRLPVPALPNSIPIHPFYHPSPTSHGHLNYFEIQSQLDTDRRSLSITHPPDLPAGVILSESAGHHDILREGEQTNTYSKSLSSPAEEARDDGHPQVPFVEKRKHQENTARNSDGMNGMQIDEEMIVQRVYNDIAK